MLHQVVSYLKFLFKSTNQHGVHSPFVYSLVTKCFYDEKRHDAYDKISAYKKDLLKNTSEISVTDLGPGSRVTKSKERQISEIAKNAGSTKKRAQLLYRLNCYFKSNHILELGTSLGIATYSLHLGHKTSQITTIEGCPKISLFTEDYLQKNNAKNIQVVNGEFSEAISNLKQNFDIIYIDGNHTKEATLNYFEALLNHAHNDTTFIFDDIYWSKGMTEAWEIIKKHPKVSVTINCYWCGFVFIRQEQAKEDFVIRL